MDGVSPKNSEEAEEDWLCGRGSKVLVNLTQLENGCRKARCGHVQTDEVKDPFCYKLGKIILFFSFYYLQLYILKVQDFWIFWKQLL